MLQLSGDRLHATYHIQAEPDDARRMADVICIEQTVEFPADLVTRADIRDQIFGRIESLERIDAQHSAARISYAVETSGQELVQLLNLVFGNISIVSGVRLVDLALPPALIRAFRGPRYGRAGLRARLGAPTGPLLASALKPMGLSAKELASLAHKLALGGMDLVKDDHGLVDQPFCRFEERVRHCAAAIAEANATSGGHCLYLPNVSGPTETLAERAAFARDQGAAGVLIAPGLVGWDAVRRLAEDDALGLIVLGHPALLGSFTTTRCSGIAHGVLYGLLQRLAGIDAAIFPTYGGRFAFSEAECREVVEATARPTGHLAPIFPAPAGGMTLSRVPEMVSFYGDDTIFLIGGDLHRSDDLVGRCRQFRDLTRAPL